MAQADFLCCTYFADVCYNGRGEKINNTYDENNLTGYYKKEPYYGGSL